METFAFKEGGMVKEKLLDRLIEEACCLHDAVHRLEDALLAYQDGLVSMGYLRKVAAEVVNCSTKVMSITLEEACHGIGSE